MSPQANIHSDFDAPTPEPKKKPSKTQGEVTLHLDEQTRAAFESDALSLLNMGDVKALMEMKGMGKKKAERVVEYREAHGPLATVIDLPM